MSLGVRDGALPGRLFAFKVSVVTAIFVLALIGIVILTIHMRRNEQLALARREASARATTCIEQAFKSQAELSVKTVRRRCASAISAFYDLKCPDQPPQCEDEAAAQIYAWLNQEQERAQRRRVRIDKLKAQEKRNAEIDAALVDLARQKGIKRDEVKERFRDEIEEEVKDQQEDAASPDD
ncbi:hypothetical protein ACRAWG_15155 [Methylobacterium sp. P31]